MKKITYPIILVAILVGINACAGYKPIFGSSNLEFKIIDYSIIGNKQLGNQIYSQLFNLSKLNENSPRAKDIYLKINLKKNKNATTKNSAGKILTYRISLIANIEIKDFLTNKIILNENFDYSLSYKVQDQYSETVKLENKSLENLINKTYEDLLIKMSENILLQ